MSKMHAKVMDFMTKNPHAVNISENLQNAHDTMVKIGARHLPVMQDGKLTGILSERDIQLAKGFKHGNLKTMSVDDVYENQVYVTHADSNLKDVSAEMAERRIGSAVVVEGDKPVGIFTTTDACRALANVLG